jgi:hypothetical protein
MLRRLNESARSTAKGSNNGDGASAAASGNAMSVVAGSDRGAHVKLRGRRASFKLVAPLLLALCVSPTIARADSFDPISIGAHVGTLGAGVTLERPLLFDLSARLTTGLLSTTSMQSYNNAPWTSTFHENNVLAAMDWRPYGGRWRLSGGLLFGGDYVNKVAQSTNGNYLLNGNSYPVSGAGVVSARVSYARPAIYLGLGGGTGVLRGLTIDFDAGIVVRNGSLSTSATGPLAGDAAFQSDLAATASQFRTRLIQPVIGIGLVYRP